VYQKKSQTQDGLSQHTIDGAALIQNNHESMQKATYAVLKQVHLRIANARGHFKQQAA
jgi:hypothetical protein